MYKLLLATDQPTISELFENGIAWDRLGFRKPFIVSTSDEAITLIKTSHIDAVASRIGRKQASSLNSFLQDVCPNLPIFEACAIKKKQLQILDELKRFLNCLHADFADENYDESIMMDIVRDDLAHSLLTGKIPQKEILERRMMLIRSDAALNKTCVLYEMNMPNGENYLADRWHHGQERLENALRSNFFGRFFDGTYYAVAVLTSRQLRVAAIPGKKQKITEEEFTRKTDEHVQNTLRNIKEYLGLDVEILQSSLVPSLADVLKLVK